MSTTVTYKSNTLTTASNETKVLKTAGTWLEDDITIQDETDGIDITDSTITADTILSGYVGYTANGTRVTGTASGGVVYQDENGALNFSQSGSIRPGNIYQDPEGYIVLDNSDPWTWKADGKTHIWLNIEHEENLTNTIKIKNVSSTTPITIDWGDGSAIDSIEINSSSYTYYQPRVHTYSNLGIYEIVISSNGDIVLGEYHHTSSSVAACNTIAIELSNLYFVSINDLSNFFRLKAFNFGANNQNKASMFTRCYKLECVVVTDISSGYNNYFYQDCSSLKDDLCNFGNYTIINTSTFQGAGIRKLIIPTSCTSISGSYCFRYCYSLIEIHITNTETVPITLANTNAFTNTRPDLKIYVPYSIDHSILTAYQEGTNWSSFASQIYEEEAPS